MGGKRTLAQWILNRSVQPVEMLLLDAASPIPQEDAPFTVDELAVNLANQFEILAASECGKLASRTSMWIWKQLIRILF